jgi:hypothetical protein
MAGAIYQDYLLSDQRLTSAHSRAGRLTFAPQIGVVDWWPKLLKNHLQATEKIST